MPVDTPTLDAAGLRQYQALQREAIEAVARRFYPDYAASLAQFGPRGQEACREDLGFHLEFLRPVLEFGLIQPMVDYLRWLAGVLVARDIPAEHLALSLDWFSEFFAARMESPNAGIVVAALHRVKARFIESDADLATIFGTQPKPWPEWQAFEDSLLAGDRRAARTLVERCVESGAGLVEMEVHMIQPALVGIGQKWQDNLVSVAQEHLASAIAQFVMTDGLLKSAIPAANGKRVLLACVAGNAHSIGLQMVADAFQLGGWGVQYLGANVPTDALIKHVGESKPDLLGLSVSFPQQLRVVREIMALLTQRHGAERPAVIVGGQAINRFSGLAGELGADAWSPDALSAVVSAKEIVSRPDPG